MPASDAQKAAVKASWDEISAAWGADGGAFFCTLWEEQAGSFDYFAKEGAFKGKSLAEAKGCGGELAAQAKAFGNLVGDWVNNINDAGKLKSLCDAFAAKHKARNISAAQIQGGFDCFLGFAAKKYSKTNADAWKAVVADLMGLISPGL